MRLVGANDEILMYHAEKLTWLAGTRSWTCSWNSWARRYARGALCESLWCPLRQGAEAQAGMTTAVPSDAWYTTGCIVLCILLLG